MMFMFMRRPPFRCSPHRGGPRAAAALMEIPQRAGEQRNHPVLVQSRGAGGGQPAEQGLVQPGELGQSDLAQRGLDERALARPARRQALGLQVTVGLQHRVRVDGQRGDHVPDLGELVAGLEVAQPQRVLHLLDQLQVGRHAGGGIQPKLDRRPRPARPIACPPACRRHPAEAPATAGAPVSGRPANSPRRSARVLALMARPTRSSNSAWSRRPAAKCSASRPETASRSALETRRCWSEYRPPLAGEAPPRPPGAPLSLSMAIRHEYNR